VPLSGALGLMKTVWSKNTIFAQYSKKFFKNPILLKKAGFKPSTPWGNSGGHCENVGITCLAKIGFCDENTIFADFPQPANTQFLRIFAACQFLPCFG
jgi:hypothetical protein